MSIYEPGDGLIADAIVPPLQYYKKDYQEFLDQFQGGIDIEYRGLSIITGDNVAFSHGLERERNSEGRRKIRHLGALYRGLSQN